MKKIIPLSLVILMIVLSFAGCSSKAPTKDELLEQAIEVDAYDINNDSFDNFIRAKETYCNKTLKLTGIITDFGDNYVVVSGSNGSEYVVDVYLSTEEMVNLESGQWVVVVGQTSDEITDTSTEIAEYTFEYKHFQMPTAFVVQDRFEYKGVVQSSGGVILKYDNGKRSEHIILVDWKDDVNISDYEWKEIKFSAKMKYNSNLADFMEFYDAEVIEEIQ